MLVWGISGKNQEYEKGKGKHSNQMVQQNRKDKASVDLKSSVSKAQMMLIIIISKHNLMTLLL